MDIIKVIDRDIASVKERIDSENKDGRYEYEFDGKHINCGRSIRSSW